MPLLCTISAPMLPPAPDSSGTKAIRPCVWTSYDDGTTWNQTPVVNLGTKAVALVNNSKATTFVTLKVELTDSNGKSVTQTLTRFYGIR
jgi:hypothetical protein